MNIVVFRGVSRNGTLDGISVLNEKGTILKNKTYEQIRKTKNKAKAKQKAKQKKENEKRFDHSSFTSW